MDHSRKEEDALNSQSSFSGFARMPMHKNQPLHARPDLPQANRELKYQFARTRSTSDEYGINIFGMTHHDNSLPRNPPESVASPENLNVSNNSATNGNDHLRVEFPTSSIVSNSTVSTAEESDVEDDIKAAAMILTSSRPPSTIG